jgi:four helix bundle protein
MENKKKFDIHDRIFLFVIRVLRLIKALPKTFENKALIEQLIRSVTSVGANDQEADGVSTKRDFIHCYTIVRKEAKETKYWLRLLAELNNAYKPRMGPLIQENEEIIRIVSSILKNASITKSIS